LGNPTTPGTLQYNAADGDTVYQFDTVTQNYKDSSLYIDGFGWLNNSDPSVDGPLIDVGTGFWVQSPGVTRNWDRNFTVN
jgi:hypothetical protein